MKIINRKFVLFIYLIACTGCVFSTIDPKSYAPLPEVLEQFPEHSYLKGKIEIGDVQVSIPNTNPAPYQSFKDGLTLALSQAGMLSKGDAPYILDANLKDFEILDRGFDYTDLLISAEYILRENQSGKVVYQETLNVPYHNENTLADIRATLTQLGLDPADPHLTQGVLQGITLRENVTQLLRILSMKKKSDLI